MSLRSCDRSRGQSSTVFDCLSLARVEDLGTAAVGPGACGHGPCGMPCQSLWSTVEWNVCCGAELLGRAMATKKKKAGRTRGRGVVRRAAAKSARLSAGEWFEKLAAVQARLRAPDGCPWDREQTHASLRTYLIEEAYEVLEALESGDDGKFAEEMGDLLLQIMFHSQIAKEEGRFTIVDVIREIYE